MSIRFLSDEWAQAVKDGLNADPEFAKASVGHTATLQQVLGRRSLDEHERALGDQQPATEPRPDPGPGAAGAS